MASGKQSRRRRREVQLRTTPSRQASRKVLLGAAALAALGALSVVLIAALSGGSPPAREVQAHGSLAGALPGAEQVHRRFKGIAQDGNRLGSPSAPVTLVEYVDLQCPFCRDFETQTLPSLVSRYVRAGKLRIELRPLAFIGPDSISGRGALIAAARQDRMFDLASLLYQHQGAENTGWLDDRMVEAAAASVPLLEVSRLLADRDSAASGDKAQQLDMQAQADNVTSTPTILIGPSGGPLQQVELSSPTDEATLAEAIDSALG